MAVVCHVSAATDVAGAVLALVLADSGADFLFAFVAEDAVKVVVDVKLSSGCALIFVWTLAPDGVR